MPTTFIIEPGHEGEPGFISDYDEYGTPIGTPFYELPGALSEGYISENRLYLGPQDLFGTPLGPEGTNFYVLSENGDVQVQIGTQWQNINRGTSLNAEYGVAGTIGITTAEGTYDLPITFAKLARTGKRWAEFVNPETGETSNHMVSANLTLAELNAQARGWSRWLSPDEVVAQALAGKMYSLAGSNDPVERDQFDAMLDAMGMTREEFESDASGSVQGWVQANYLDLSAATRYTYAAGG